MFHKGVHLTKKENDNDNNITARTIPSNSPINQGYCQTPAVARLFNEYISNIKNTREADA